ncbi:MAG: hypothetical protein U0V48_18625 [Anaerolineales bacterium]
MQLLSGIPPKVALLNEVENASAGDIPNPGAPARSTIIVIVVKRMEIN